MTAHAGALEGIVTGSDRAVQSGFLLGSLALAPILEEVVYRGILLHLCLSFLPQYQAVTCLDLHQPHITLHGAAALLIPA